MSRRRIAPRTLENLETKETYTFLERARDTGGQVLRLRWTAQPGGEVGEHIHPLQEERFEVTAGVLTVSLEGDEIRCPKGQVVAVPAGKRHFFANREKEPVTAILELRPALRMEQVFESLAGFAREGRTRAGGLPRHPLQLAVFAWEFRREIRGPHPPQPVQAVILPPLAAVARVLGYRAHRPEYGIDLAGHG
jgi:quercetin dioxygenase-like cupin family protein